MQLFGGGDEFLQRSDVPQWNLLTGTSQKLQTITIHKGNYYPGSYQRGDWNAEPMYNGLATYSVYVVNQSAKYPIALEIDSASATVFSKLIPPKSEGRLYATASKIFGLYFKTNSNAAKQMVDEDVVFQIKEEKLEPGSVATAWCPAREDYAMKSDKILTIKNLVQTLFSDELVTIVDDSFDMNNAVPGIYRSWGKKPINTPNECVAWAKYFVIPFAEGDKDNFFQIAIDINGNIFTRAKGGNPVRWTSWHNANLG